MIDAKELRLGNWVERLDGSQFQITASDIELISRITPQLTPNPIILTPEVLEACGFELSHEIKFDYDGSVCKYFTSNKKGCEYFIVYWECYNLAKDHCCYDHDIIGEELKFLHTLQNLYFSLTGQELEYKPKV